MTIPPRVPRLVSVLLLAAGLASAAPATVTPKEAYQSLRWRLLGPFRAGWATCATGVTDHPDVFYFGGADGGVWKTTDAGLTWSPVVDGQDAAAVGAIAAAPGDPNVLYVGTGQVAQRYDITSGSGVYRTGDGGKTWTHVGLADSRHVGRILVDPHDSDLVLVAALGHVFGPNAERGVFRTTDGGKTWQKVLFQDDDTGAVDLAWDPARPAVVYAALWQVRRYPWQAYFTPTAGPGSGIYRSEDEGTTWTPVGGKGLPEGPLGRIGLAVSPGGRLYALVEATKGSGLYRSDDGGASFALVHEDRGAAGNYFGRVTADPRDPDTVYLTGRSLKRSTDGGRTFTITKGAPGGDDYHFMWISPQDPSRMILGADQGATVSVTGGATWSSWYNQPTGQFYHLGVDDRFPYWVYSSQQDSGTVGIASRSDYGQLTFRDWHPVGGDERDFSLPDPKDPDTVFVSGLGGRLSRWDAKTGRVANVSPWPVGSYAARPTTVRYRYTWITPIAFGPKPEAALYQGAQVLFRTTDGGTHWDTISPDLTGADPAAKGCDGDVPIDRATACGYGVIFTIAPSPLDAGLVWIGTDNGRIQLTRDGGKTWRNVTPEGLPGWSKIASIDASPTEPGSAYAAVDRHRLDDFAPHVYRTHDYGATWTEVSEGLPAGSFVNVVRQDPVQPRLLYAGTRTAVFVSFDDGDHWQSLALGLPTTGVNDLAVHGNDLVAATEGRGLWVLDDVSPLRHLAPDAMAAPATLLPPATAYRVRGNENRDTPLPPEEPTAPNPPAGAVIDYLLGPGASGPVSLEVRDAAGQVVGSWASDKVRERPKAERYFAADWLQPPAALPARPGHNRFVWNLRYPRPPAVAYEYSIGAVPGVDTPALPQGMLVPPGRYEVRLTVDGKTVSAPLTVASDPRAHVSEADLEAQLELWRRVGTVLGRAVEAADAIHAASGHSKADLSRFERGPSEDNVRAIAAALSSLAIDLEAADGPPTEPQRGVLATYEKRLATALDHWHAVQRGGR